MADSRVLCLVPLVARTLQFLQPITPTRSRLAPNAFFICTTLLVRVVINPTLPLSRRSLFPRVIGTLYRTNWRLAPGVGSHPEVTRLISGCMGSCFPGVASCRTCGVVFLIRTHRDLLYDRRERSDRKYKL